MANFSYRTVNNLILLPVILYGKRGPISGEFVLDTGASVTVLDHSVVTLLGYSVRDGIGISTVSSVVGKEQGYRLQVEAFETLGKHISKHEVVCHDLITQGVEGLIGMSFLEQFDWCIHPKEKRISTP